MPARDGVRDPVAVRRRAAAALFWLFRFAMGLRYAKLERERERSALLGQGRRPGRRGARRERRAGALRRGRCRLRSGDVSLAKAELVGVRLLVNGRVVDSRQRPGSELGASEVEEHEGRERWTCWRRCPVALGRDRVRLARRRRQPRGGAARVRGAGAGAAGRRGMKSHTQYLTLNVPVRMDFVNITGDGGERRLASGVREGLCLVNAMHITASVFINDDEPGCTRTTSAGSRGWRPFDPSPERYHHNRTGEDNGDAHHKRQLMGREVVVAVTRGALDFGPWEQIFYGEFDGPAAQEDPGQDHRRVREQLPSHMATAI
jgi:secondary thiamine-phosphate synthase enzyme